jgi:hypothetical protein
MHSTKSRPAESPAAIEARRRARHAKQTVVIVSQVFVPDPASVGQHMFDVAAELARRGYHVRVYTSSRGYDDPSVRYPARETRDGVEIRRLPLASFGKKSILTRILGTVSFMLQAFLRTLFTLRLSGVVFSTSPPMIGVAMSVLQVLRSVPTVYWAMDLNPDQLIALGKIRERSLPARVLETANRAILRSATLIVALDRFMARRLMARADLRDKLVVIPPWPHESFVEPIAHEDNPFRTEHALAGKFVVMYSGNHSPSNPLDTLLEAALRHRDDDRVRFLFVGGGVGKKAVEAFVARHALANVICLPYQPLDRLRFSLSAADVHVVSLGEDMVGIIHPCKVYGAMAVGRPVLFFGPRPSHVSDLLDKHSFGWHVAHGDVEAATATIGRMRDTPRQTLEAMGATAQRVLAESLSQDILCKRFCDGVELALRP